MDLHETTEFWKLLTEEILIALPRYYGKDNWDAERFGRYKRPIYEIPLHIVNTWTPLKIVPPSNNEGVSVEPSYGLMRPYLDGFASTYTRLQDDYSRSLFIRLVAYRILGFHKVKLPRSLDSAGLESKRAMIRNLIDHSAAGKKAVGSWTLDLMDLSPLGYPVHCYSTQNGILTTFVLKQYEYRQEGIKISVSPGDCVIDGGGGWGDTALFFSCAAGDQGKVYSFEFDPQNLDIFLKNLVLNPGLSRRISVIPQALWCQSGDSINYAANGPGTTIASGYDQRTCDKELQVTTISIDDFVQKNGLEKVDYIKMDIEAAELNALKGAADTIRRFRPILAIAMYHQISDFAEIPRFLSELTVNYSFFLDHFTIHHEETVLFAVPEEKIRQVK
jgi:FkbM family methyltransferase